MITKNYDISRHLVPNEKELKQISSQKLTKDSLFASKRQKDTLVQKLKKGTLFRLTNHLKPEQKPTFIDPYITWLEDNSSHHIDESLGKKTMGETFFYLNTCDLQKQKKSTKTILPTIEKYKSAFLDKQSVLNSGLKENRSLCIQDQSKSQNKSFCFHEKESLKKNRSLLIEPQNTTNYTHLKSSHKEKLNCTLKQCHKGECYQHKLSQTQIFPKNLKNSFYVEKENLIKSQFYLNDHKKKGYQTFYLQPKIKLEPDSDLRRVKGFQRTFVKSFDENLKKVEKEASVSCYNEVAQYFSSMKDQVSVLIKESNSIHQFSSKENLRQKQVQQKVRQKVNPRRLKTLINKDDRIQAIKNDTQAHVPKFLLESILFGQTSNLFTETARPIQKIRI